MSSLSFILRRAAVARRGGRTVALGIASRCDTGAESLSLTYSCQSGGYAPTWQCMSAIKWHPKVQTRLHSTQAEPTPDNTDACSTFGTSERFEDLPNLHPSSKRAVTGVLGLSTMTEIQSKTFDAASSGRDILGRARTGTGKTLAFLLPAIESVLRHGDEPGDSVGVLVMSPTRELALQIHEQARILTSCHRHLNSQVMFGGSSRRDDVRRLERRLPTVLVATPGRLQDHLSSTTLRGGVPFSELIRRTRVLVLDETDRLLDMGFRAEIERIISYLPSERQTLLFSATLPPPVRSVMASTMRPDFVTVDCVHDHDPATHTNAQVDQSHVILPTTAAVDGPVRILTQIMDDNPDHKLIAFFPTAQLTSYYSQLFNFVLRRKVIEIHSRKSQSYRTSASNRFREKAGRVAMFTSDVSARGVDYPGVTDVVQVGVPDSRETYIHRLGRTGRAGRRGRGLLVLSEPERAFLDALEGLDVPLSDEFDGIVSSSLSSAVVGNGRSDDAVAEQLGRMRRALRAGQNSSLEEAVGGAYRSMLGYYNSRSKLLKLRGKGQLVSMVNDFAAAAGLEDPPTISPRIARSVGLERVAGLNIGPGGGGGRGRNGGGGGGGGRGRGRSFSRGYEGGKRNSGARNAWGDRGGRRRGEYGGGSISGGGSYEEWGRGLRVASDWDRSSKAGGRGKDS